MKGHDGLPRLLLVCAFALALAAAAAAQDPSKVAPQAFTEKLNNAQVQVFEYHSKPGDKEPMHSHRANVVYVIQGGKERFTLPDGKTEEKEFKSGDVIWREASTHAVENIGTTEMRSLIVELKSGAPKMEMEKK
ncbi:MAG TPA: cytoplasmic protein [Thermoanaerobaculia bacterium]|nr:cytoplasmic protein [Thermoanaerobaculia bacterium]